MRLRDRVIGVLNVFSRRTLGLREEDLKVAQVLASMATIGILTHRSMQEQVALAAQLQVALNSRVVIEQAKGVIAESGKLSMDDAFALLRGAARAERRSLSELAADVVSKEVAVRDLQRMHQGRRPRSPAHPDER